ncbi:MAG: histidinol dehydrogenase [Gammaproteobacteria bacterium]|nr:histidinol dehydrogenase [Gammaproteobacteria bacterium]
MTTIKRLNAQAAEFPEQLAALTAFALEDGREVEATVREIVDAVRHQGDAALVRLTNRFDRRTVSDTDELVLTPEQIEDAWSTVEPPERDALAEAAERIREFHAHQRDESWRMSDRHGNVLGQQVRALDRVGIYVPGGKAAYPSSVLMNAIPAKVAGVEEVVMVVPAPDGVLEPMVLAAARAAGVDRIFTLGGAQAVAALAFGTETVPAVDKIVGPGNIYVATAKRQVFGVCGIDMIAGPSEILIISDGSADPAWLALDLFAQAEHDEDARAILISPDRTHLDRMEQTIARLLPKMERRAIIETSLAHRGALIDVADLEAGVDLANTLAPEHLELAVAQPEQWVDRVKHAGAIFLGAHSPEAFGDYCAGPNHVLPTARTARFSSPLGVYDFQKRSSIIHCSPDGARMLAPLAQVLASGEGLAAHAYSAKVRDGSNGVDL